MKQISGILLMLLFIGCVEKPRDNNDTSSQHTQVMDTSGIDPRYQHPMTKYYVAKLDGEEEVYGQKHRDYLSQTLSRDEIVTINQIDDYGINSSNNGGHYADHFAKPTFVKSVTIEQKVDELLARIDGYTLTSKDSAKIALEWNKKHR